MITLLFTLLIVVAVLAVKEMAKTPEKTFPEAATDGLKTFFGELKLVIAGISAKKKSCEKKEEQIEGTVDSEKEEQSSEEVSDEIKVENEGSEQGKE